MTPIPKVPAPYRIRLASSGAGPSRFQLEVVGFEQVAGRIINGLVAFVAAFVAWMVWTRLSPGSHESPYWTAVHWGAFSLLMGSLLLAISTGLMGLLVRKRLLLHPDFSRVESVWSSGGVAVCRRTWSTEDFNHVRFRIVCGGYKSGAGYEVSLIGSGHLLECTTSRDRAESVSVAHWLGELTSLPVQGIPEEPSSRRAPEPAPIIRTFGELNAAGIPTKRT